MQNIEELLANTELPEELEDAIQTISNFEKYPGAVSVMGLINAYMTKSESLIQISKTNPTIKKQLTDLAKQSKQYAENIRSEADLLIGKDGKGTIIPKNIKPTFENYAQTHTHGIYRITSIFPYALNGTIARCTKAAQTFDKNEYKIVGIPHSANLFSFIFHCFGFETYNIKPHREKLHPAFSQIQVFNEIPKNTFNNKKVLVLDNDLVTGYSTQKVAEYIKENSENYISIELILSTSIWASPNSPEEVEINGTDKAKDLIKNFKYLGPIKTYQNFRKFTFHLYDTIKKVPSIYNKVFTLNQFQKDPNYIETLEKQFELLPKEEIPYEEPAIKLL